MTPPRANATHGARLSPRGARGSARRARRPRRLSATGARAACGLCCLAHGLRVPIPKGEAVTSPPPGFRSRVDEGRVRSGQRARSWALLRPSSASTNGQQHAPCRGTAVGDRGHLLSPRVPLRAPSSPVPRAGHCEERPRATRALPGHGHL